MISFQHSYSKFVVALPLELKTREFERKSFNRRRFSSSNENKIKYVHYKKTRKNYSNLLKRIERLVFT